MWHHALNNDLRIAPVGGEDSITSLHRTKLIGSVRTYAMSGPELSIESWIAVIVTAGVLVYLVYTLLRPERF